MHAQRGLIAAARRDQLANDTAMAIRQHEDQRRARLAEDCATAEASLMDALRKPDTSLRQIRHSINVASNTGLVAPRLLQDAQHHLYRSTKREMVRATRHPSARAHRSRPRLMCAPISSSHAVPASRSRDRGCARARALATRRTTRHGGRRPRAGTCSKRQRRGAAAQGAATSEG